MSRIIRASEINLYMYCAKAWWLGAIEGVKPGNVRELSRGSIAHARHGRAAAAAGLAQRAGVGLLLIGGLLAFFWFAAGGA